MTRKKFGKRAKTGTNVNKKKKRDIESSSVNSQNVLLFKLARNSKQSTNKYNPGDDSERDAKKVCSK